MKTSASLIIIVSLIIIFNASCEKVIDMEVDKTPPKLVLNTYLQTDSVIKVHVSRSTPILNGDSGINIIIDADVKVYENDVLRETLHRPDWPKENFYTSDTLKPKPGKTYRIEVSADGYQTITGTAYIPVPVPIAQIDTSFHFYSDTFSYYVMYSLHTDIHSYYSGKIKISFEDPSNEENFYCIKLNPYEFKIENSLIEAYIAYDGYQIYNNYDNGSAHSIIANSIFFSDALFNGKKVEFELSMGFDSIFYVQLLSINKDYFKYVKSRALYQNAEPILYERVQLLNNIQNGYGIITGSSSSCVKIVGRRISSRLGLPFSIHRVL